MVPGKLPDAKTNIADFSVIIYGRLLRSLQILKRTQGPIKASQRVYTFSDHLTLTTALKILRISGITPGRASFCAYPDPSRTAIRICSMAA